MIAIRRMEQSVVTHVSVRPGYSYSFAVSEFYAYGRTYGIVYRHQHDGDTSANELPITASTDDINDGSSMCRRSQRHHARFI